MADENMQVRIDLTPEQQKQVEKLTGRKSEFLNFTLSELEARIAPMKYPQLD